MTDGNDPFIGDGEVRALARSIDWSATPLGPVESWPGPLRDVVRTCLESPFPINLWCEPGLVLIYNDAYRAVLGSKHPRALGRPGSEVWAEIWPVIGPMFDRIRDGGPPVFQEDSPFVVERAEDEPGAREAGTGGDGASEASGRAARREPNAWFTFSLSPVRDRDGRIVAFLNVVSESTRRLQAEEAREAARDEAEQAEARLRDVFSHAPAFMAVLRGEDHVFEYANSAYYQLVGHRDLIGKPVLEALPEVRGQGFEALLDRVLETGEPYVGREMSVLLSPEPGAPTEEHFVDFVYYPMTEADGTRFGVVAHGADVTDHVLARREAQRARAEAEKANLAKSRFLATMSHEIRTPINAAMGYADLLDARVSGELSERQQKYVDGIRTSSRHLLGLVSDVLDLAKIEAGEMTVAAEPIPLRPAVDEALHLIRPQTDRKGLALNEVWECDDATRVLADEDRIRQILLNLLSNALKFTEAGGRITIRCRLLDSAPAEAVLPEVGPWVVVEVEDTGRGISAAKLSRVFEPFVQEESGHTRRAGGTGLGLTISRRLARLMGGELTARSEVGVGSRFCLWLAPAVQERVATRHDSFDDAAAWPPEPHELPGLASLGRTLLSVIDEAEEEWVARVRADPRVTTASQTTRAQLADQTAELVAAIAKALYALEEGAGDPALLRDAEAVHGIVARRHGRQRRRLGWSRAELVREYVVLGEVLDDLLRREAPRRTAADLGTGMVVVDRLIRRATAASLAAFDGRADPAG